MEQASNSRIRRSRQASVYADKSFSTVELNADELITDVFERKTIWNRSGVNPISQWRAISIKYDLSVEFLKSKWNNLRKAFRKELKKIPRNEKNEYLEDPHLFSSKWRYYRSMLFLLDRIHLQPISEIPVKTKVKTSLASSSNSIGITGNKRRLDNVNCENEDDENVNTTPFGKVKKNRNEPVVNDHQKQMKNTADVESDIEEVVEEAADVSELQIPNVSPLATDSDYLFLMSLYYFMDKVHPLRKLHVRSLILNILDKELTHH